MAQALAWAIISEWDGAPFAFTARHTRVEAIRALLEIADGRAPYHGQTCLTPSEDRAWRRYKRRGFRAARVVIREFGK